MTFGLAADSFSITSAKVVNGFGAPNGSREKSNPVTLPPFGWDLRADETVIAFLVSNTSDLSCAVFFCSGRSAGTSRGDWTSATASWGASPGWGFFSWPPASPERAARIRQPVTRPAANAAGRPSRDRMVSPRFAGGSRTAGGGKAHSPRLPGACTPGNLCCGPAVGGGEGATAVPRPAAFLPGRAG